MWLCVYVELFEFPIRHIVMEAFCTSSFQLITSCFSESKVPICKATKFFNSRKKKTRWSQGGSFGFYEIPQPMCHEIQLGEDHRQADHAWHCPEEGPWGYASVQNGDWGKEGKVRLCFIRSFEMYQALLSNKNTLKKHFLCLKLVMTSSLNICFIDH